MSAERIKIIQETVARAQELKDLKARQEQTNEARRLAQIEAIRAQNETRLRGTEVVQLFEQLRKSGIVTADDHPVYGDQERKGWFGSRMERVKVRDYDPAIVMFRGENHDEVVLLYNRVFSRPCNDNDDGGEAYSGITAQIFPDGSLKVNGEIVNNNLYEVVTRAILKAKGL